LQIVVKQEEALAQFMKDRRKKSVFEECLATIEAHGFI
jgi:hypothetical protein